MKHFLVIRFSSIGDIVLTTPVIRRLKEQTGGQVHVLTKRSFAKMLESNPYVDKVITIDSKVSEAYAELDKTDYDEVIDLHNNLRSASVKSYVKAPSHSFPKLNIQKFILVNFKINNLPDIHIVDRYMEAVKHLGVHDDGKGLDYFIPSNVHVDIAGVFSEAYAEGFVAFVIGGQHDGKMCSREKIAEICSEINDPVILLGGPEDAEKGRWIAQHAKGEVANAAGNYSLDESAFLLKESNAVITHDTGLMHIASALGKRVLSLWGGTVPELGMYPYRPGEGSEILEVKHPMRPSSKLGSRKGIYKLWNFMDMIPTEKIISSLQGKTTV